MDTHHNTPLVTQNNHPRQPPCPPNHNQQDLEEAQTKAEEEEAALVRRYQTVDLYIKNLNGRTSMLEANLDNTIANLTATIANNDHSMHLGDTTIYLIFNGRKLDPTLTLDQTGITHHSTIHTHLQDLFKGELEPKFPLRKNLPRPGALNPT
eukprot:16446008-Heterocapsa_arctica.AAC.1